MAVPPCGTGAGRFARFPSQTAPLFLASPAAASITDQTLVVDGGRVMP